MSLRHLAYAHSPRNSQYGVSNAGIPETIWRKGGTHLFLSAQRVAEHLHIKEWGVRVKSRTLHMSLLNFACLFSRS